MKAKDLPVIELFPTPETFATDLVRIEVIGPCARLVFACDSGRNDERALVLAAKVIVPLTELVMIARHILAGEVANEQREEIARLQ